MTEQINGPTTEDSSAVPTNCPMCGGKKSATLDNWNGGWTDIQCSECGGGTFYLWSRAEKPCTHSLTMLHK
jgi:predicted nucleic-acid-binding Zn-ribbon protein